MRHVLATVALGPLLLLQGRRVRRVVPVLPEPTGARSGSLGDGPLLRLLVVGDSAAAGVGAAAQDEALVGRLGGALAPTFRVDWRLEATTGATTADTLEHLRHLPAERWDAVVTSLGVNDVTGRLSLGRWRRHQLALIDLLRARFGAAHVVLSALPPMHRFPALPQPLRWYVGSRARDFNRVLAGAAQMRPGCDYLELDHAALDVSAMAGDGFHPGPPIYALWAREAAARIVRRRQAGDKPRL